MNKFTRRYPNWVELSDDHEPFQFEFTDLTDLSIQLEIPKDNLKLHTVGGMLGLMEVRDNWWWILGWLKEEVKGLETWKRPED